MPTSVRYRRALRATVRGRCLGLKLRREFQGGALGPTSVELANGAATGASQVPAGFFLGETYPGALLEAALSALEAGKGRPLVLCGVAGTGKSHVLAALHHCLESPTAYERWLRTWDQRLERQEPSANTLRRGVQVLSKGLDNSGYQFLADYILGWHVRGEWARAKWEHTRSSAYENPSRELLAAMFEACPAVFIFDGLQPWLDSLPECGERRLRTAAVELIQTLASIAAERPDQLGLVFSVEDSASQAFRTLSVTDPLVLESGHECYRRDRSYRLVQRLFENRWDIPADTLHRRLQPFVDRYASLVEQSSADPEDSRSVVLKSWPFTPGLVQLIEDRIDVDDTGQANRIVIKLLVDLFEKQSRRSILIALADIGLSDHDGGIADWLSAAMDKRGVVIRERAVDTLSRVLGSAKRSRRRFPHASAVMTALWVRSIPPRCQDAEFNPGADIDTLLLDVGHNEAIEPERFEAEVGRIAEVALYVHQDGGRYCIREQPNPRSHLLVEACNSEHFADGSDQGELARQVEYVLGTRRRAGSAYRLVVLRRNWRDDPWSDLERDQKPAYWDGRIVMVAMPESCSAIDAQLGLWLKTHVHERRNTVRFLLPTGGAPNIYSDPQILPLVRGMLLARRWEKANAEYAQFHEEFRLRLHDLIRERFGRFALLDRWDEEDPRRSSFHVADYRSDGAPIADTVDSYIRRNLMEAGDFDEWMIEFTRSTETVATLLRAAQEPARNGHCTVPWLGRRAVLDKLAELCATGRITIDLASSLEADRNGDDYRQNAYKRIYDEIHKNPQIDKSWLKYRTCGGPQGSLAESTEERAAPLSSSEHIYRMAESADEQTRKHIAALLDSIIKPDGTGSADCTAPATVPAPGEDDPDN